MSHLIFLFAGFVLAVFFLVFFGVKVSERQGVKLGEKMKIGEKGFTIIAGSPRPQDHRVFDTKTGLPISNIVEIEYFVSGDSCAVCKLTIWGSKVHLGGNSLKGNIEYHDSYKKFLEHTRGGRIH